LDRAPSDFGERITSLVTLPLPRPHKEPSGSVVGHILHIDSFGNLITDITGQDLPATDRPLTVKVGNQTIRSLSRTYAEGEGLLALIGSSDHLEISVKGGSAHGFLNAEVGDKVRVSPQD
ncbi:MAG: SAM-dependent chlorinase/fluorinase, partial [Dehalococcoidales bacterium]